MNKNKLRIIDVKAEDGKTDQVEMELVVADTTIKQQVAYFPSPVHENFKEQLNWYYNDFLHNPYGEQRKKAQRVANQIVSFGKKIGRNLLGDQDTNNDLLQKMGEVDMRSLVVTIESDRTEFFEEHWEMLLLPGSDICLAASCAGFFRVPQTSASIQTLRPNTSKENPLRILMIVARPASGSELKCQAKAVDIVNHLLGYSPAFEIEILPPIFENLVERLNDKTKPPHVIHFDGGGAIPSGDDPAGDKPESAGFAFEDEKGEMDYRSIKSFAQVIAASSIKIVFYDYCRKEPAQDALSVHFAVQLIQAGVPAVVTLSQTTYTFCTIQIYQIIYSQMAQGHSMAKAVVAAREFMRRNTEQNALTAQRQDFLDWLLPVYYGWHDVHFFSENQPNVPFIQTAPFKKMLNNLIGFSPEYLPPMEFFGRDQELNAIRQALSNKKAVLVAGESGMGKTHLLHQVAYWLLLSRQVEAAFYFNGSQIKFNSTKLLESIGQFFNEPVSKEPVSDGMPAADHKGAREALLERKLLIIIDDLPEIALSDNAPGDDSQIESFLDFLNEIETGSASLVIGRKPSASPPVFPHWPQVTIEALPVEERRQFGVRCLQKNKLEDEEGDPYYLALLDALGGHPHLMETFIKRLGRFSADALLDEYLKASEKVTLDSAKFPENLVPEPLLVLFELGWHNLSRAEQQIFAAFADLEGVITDAFAIAFDMKDQSAGADFFELLDVVRPYSMATIMEKGVTAGFFIQKMTGREIQPAARMYFNLKRDTFNWPREKCEQLNFILKQIACLELKVLLPFLAQNPNPMLTQKIYAHRNRWFQSLEALWHKGSYDAFRQGKYFFQSLLAKMGLQNEFNTWGFYLLAESDLAAIDPQISPELTLAWLNLACDAVLSKPAHENGWAAKWVAHWETWLDKPQESHPSVFDHVLMFLEAHYRIKTDWPARKKISLSGLTFYKQEKDYHGVIKAMKSLARCEEALGNRDACDDYESQLINEIPYDILEEGMQQRTLLDVIFLKMNRKDFNDAQKLIDRFKTLPVFGELPYVADLFQGDIFINTGNYDSAAKIYSKLWGCLMKREHMVNPDKITQTVKMLEEKIGPEKFKKIYQENAPGVASPAEMARKQKQIE